MKTEEDNLKDKLCTARLGLLAVRDLIENSEGIYGLHLNGNSAPWGSLLEGGYFEEWLLPFSIAIKEISGENND